MRKIEKYRILHDTDQVELVISINEYIELGWQPYGSASTSIKDGEICITQPIVKYKVDN